MEPLAAIAPQRDPSGSREGSRLAGGPVVSVIVCTANRPDALAQMLDRFASIELPGQGAVQLIVVDNAPSERTRAVVDRARLRLPVAVEYHREAGRGSGAARNRGLLHAHAPLIAWTDDDCVVDGDWLTRIVAAFEEDPRLDMIGGRVELYDPAHLPMSILTSREPAIMDERMFPGGFILGCNMAYRRSVVDRVGAYDARFGAGAALRAAEDTDFVYRAFRAGCRITYRPDILVLHNHKRVASSQGKRLRRNYTFSDGAFIAKHCLRGQKAPLRWLYWRAAKLVHGLRRPERQDEPLRERIILLATFVYGIVAFACASVAPHAATARRPSGARGQPVGVRGARLVGLADGTRRR